MCGRKCVHLLLGFFFAIRFTKKVKKYGTLHEFACHPSAPFQAIFAIKIHQSAHQVLPRLQQILNGLTNHSTLSFGDRIDN